MMDPTRMPTHLRVLSTTFHTHLVPLRSRCAQASFAMEVEIVPCSSWMKQRILLSRFWPVYRVVFSFRSCPTCVVGEAMASPNTNGWKNVMEMANFKSHNVYGPVPRTNGMRTLKLGWVFHRRFKNGAFLEE